MSMALIAVAVLAGCSASNDSDSSFDPVVVATATAKPTTVPTSTPAPTRAAELKAAVTAYSAAFLTGKSRLVFAFLSKACRETVPIADVIEAVQHATDSYGLVAMTSYKAKIDGNEALVTYTYPFDTINQIDEPWIYENGWFNNRC
ncbi:hypothetical protein BH09ACT10_BH09ACT10_10240 [soil metagenome]